MATLCASVKPWTVTDIETTEIDCPDCGAKLVLKKHPKHYFLGCGRFPACHGKHSVHQKTLQPQGIPADAATRRARNAAHKHFDAMWKWKWLKPHLTRRDCYEWLAITFDMATEEAHIGLFDKDQCAALIWVVRQMMCPLGARF